MTKQNLSFLDAEILIVDDDDRNLLLLREVLAGAGYRSVYCESDSRRVDALTRRRRFDLILLDLRMPHLDGFEVMAQLDALRRDRYIPILVLTADPDSTNRLRALRGGASDYLSKPIDHAEMLCRIHNLLEVRMMHRRDREQHSILAERVQTSADLLHETRLQAIRCLGRAGECRDRDAGLHVAQVGECAAFVAEVIGVSPIECDDLRTACPLHDIGKIAIPDRILSKAGPLNAAEWSIMKTHTLVGERILSEHESPLFRTAARVARSHHEHWDGSGYPDGLRAHAIPLESRIVAVCDVFDALLSVRSYKPAWSGDRTLEYILERSGTQFDPTIVEVFEQHVTQLLAIRAAGLKRRSLDWPESISSVPVPPTATIRATG